MTRVLITHNNELLENFYSARAVERLREFVDVKMNGTDAPLQGDALVEAAQDCDIIISDRLAPGTSDVFDRLPKLAAYLRCAVDIRNVDVAAASRNGILVVRCSAGYAEAVSELALGLMIDLARKVSQSTASYKDGLVDHPMVLGRQLFGSTIGVVGYGAIGRRIVDLALAFGMRVLVNDPYVEIHHGAVTQASLPDLLRDAHFVVCAAYATPETVNLFDERAFSQMRRDAFFVNISRGVLVDEAALETALTSGRIAGAGLDVGRGKDEQPNPAIARLPNVVATPHVAGLTPEASDYQAVETVQQVRDLLAGRSVALAVNPGDAHRVARLARSDA
ncbi:D-isomer specific 2-hydroxyacid dehydrogenase [Caballeronia temeraria]|uniref:D-isomer specific 2-hydroxyacid dehydrogenase n=1 Tax=Caballeronia temeraria TaxID=1777137 RepID=A0A158CNB3_9BURK|nr:NAD(P)-dependent oxidoreductase [Caballeronia temeraria]SAK83845.1 D-isomer specific 2-hydroxyacid dehydrogenase [Caballeronia temeraria]